MENWKLEDNIFFFWVPGFSAVLGNIKSHLFTSVWPPKVPTTEFRTCESPKPRCTAKDPSPNGTGFVHNRHHPMLCEVHVHPACIINFQQLKRFMYNAKQPPFRLGTNVQHNHLTWETLYLSIKSTTQTQPISLYICFWDISGAEKPAMFWDFIGKDALSLRRTLWLFFVGHLFFVWERSGAFDVFFGEMRIFVELGCLICWHQIGGKNSI